MELWVLAYETPSKSFFVTPDKAMVDNPEQALKFNTEDEAEEFNREIESFIKYRPTRRFFDFDKK